MSSPQTTTCHYHLFVFNPITCLQTRTKSVHIFFSFHLPSCMNGSFDNDFIIVNANKALFAIKEQNRLVVLMSALFTERLASEGVCLYISPHWLMVTGIFGLLFGPVGTFSIFLTTSMPSNTRPKRYDKSWVRFRRRVNQTSGDCLPKTTCLPSRKSHLAQVMKN